MLIGLTGAAGAGKDTVAAMVAESLGEVCRVAAFASPLYQCVEAITGLPQSELRDRETKERVIPWLGKSPRELLQILGTEFGRDAIHPEIWIRALMHRIQPRLDAGQTVIVTDVRFDNEAAAIVAAGGEVWRVVRPQWRCLDETASRHSSEAGVSDHFVSRTVANDGTLDDLRAAVTACTMVV